MSRSSLGKALGTSVAILSTLLVLSGSDLPPPPGFLFVVLAAVVLGVVVALLTPRLLGRCDSSGPSRGLLTAAALGAASGAAIWLLSLPFGGEPSVERDLGDAALYLAVLAAVGALGALAVGAWAILADRTVDKARAVVVLPAAAAALVLLGLIGVRLA